VKALIGKVGLDGHNLGAKAVARALRDAGLEVVYAESLTPEQVAEVAVQEDVDLVGLSVLSGAHGYLLPECVRLLRERGKGDALVIAGGVIPQDDVPDLKRAGVAEVFGPGTPLERIVAFVREHVASSRESA